MDYDSLYKKPVIKYSSFEDSSFAAGDSPVVLDIYAALTRDIYIEISSDGTVYGDITTAKENEIADLIQHKIRKVRITHTGTNSAYRARFW